MRDREYTTTEFQIEFKHPILEDGTCSIKIDLIPDRKEPTKEELINYFLNCGTLNINGHIGNSKEATEIKILKIVTKKKTIKL